MEGTQVNIAQHLCTVVKEFLPLDKICCVVQLHNMVASGRQLHDDLKCESVVCVAHILQTCLRHSFDSPENW